MTTIRFSADPAEPSAVEHEITLIMFSFDAFRIARSPAFLTLTALTL